MTSANNTAGTAKSMFNNTFSVTGISSSRQFTVALTDDPGAFTNNTSDRTTSLPYTLNLRRHLEHIIFTEVKKFKNILKESRMVFIIYS